MTEFSEQKLRAVLSCYGVEPRAIEPLRSGLINATWRVHDVDDRAFILQRINPIFPPSVNAAIDAVTRHLEHAGLVTPRLLRTRDGMLATSIDGECWRLMTCIEGATFHTVSDAGQARAAGRQLAMFHAALTDFEYDFGDARRGIHDLDRHIRVLEAALHDHAGHANFLQIEPVAATILAAVEGLPALTPTVARVVHGDPKFSNILFAPDGSAVCLIDLDTVGLEALPVELGDAFRSWCNPAGEDGPAPRFDTTLFAAALAGYCDAARAFITAAEIRAIPTAIRRIYLELAARFCADALIERYFGWDNERYKSRSEHNLARAKNQLRAAKSLGSKLEEVLTMVETSARRVD